MLNTVIEDIRSGINTGRFANEAAVRQGIVLRLLQSLSWPTYDTQIVAPETPWKEGESISRFATRPEGRSCSSR